jgi:BASS family bile acid:Na+ symporter
MDRRSVGNNSPSSTIYRSGAANASTLTYGEPAVVSEVHIMSGNLLPSALQKTLPVWLVGISYLALQWPQLTRDLGWPDPWLWLHGKVNWLIVVTMVCVGVLLPSRQLHSLKQHGWALVFGVFVQYTAMPLLAWSCGRAAGLPEEYFLGVVLVGCVPGAMASNVLTLNAGGHVGYSISLTTLATLVSPIAVPAGLMLGLGRWQYDPLLTRSALFVTVTVVIPVAFGYVLRKRLTSPTWHALASTIANVAILLIIASVVAKSRAHIGSLTALLPLTLLAINLAGYAAGYLAATAARLPPDMRRALTLEIGMQNAGLGAALAAHLFPDHPEVAIAPALYSFGCMFTGIILSYVWNRFPCAFDTNIGP